VRKLLIGVWIVLALDLALLALMVQELGKPELGADERDVAVSIIWRFAIWIGAVNAALVLGWWRESSAWLWTALIGGGLPLLWAWAMAVQAITDSAGGS
jgi:hypothetical protein